MMEKNKPFWKSKTKIAALLIGIGPVLVTIGGILNGENLATSVPILFSEIGIILGIFGIRDLPFINK